jgi:hypothetical protein
VTCRWQGCGDLVCDAGEDTACPSDCAGSGGDGNGGSHSGSGGYGGDGYGGAGDDGGPTCCESADDACGQRGDGMCQSGCAWGSDPDCTPQPPTDDAQCCGDAGDSCGWNGNGVCDAGCAWVDIDCRIDTCEEVPDDPSPIETILRCRFPLPLAR